MHIICDCFELKHIALYKQHGISRIVVSLPFVSLREVKIYQKEDIKEYVDCIHESSMEIAINMLNFVLEENIEHFKDALLFCKENNIDYIYYADMGVYQLAKELEIENKLIYQPTTLITNSLDANNYLDLGIHSVVLSREITLEDTCAILNKCKSCEVSVFGRNVMMHSRRRLLSSYFEFIHQEDVSDSKELMLMEENRDEKMPIFQDENGTHILSGHTFCFFKELNQIKKGDFKLDGFSLNEELMFKVADDIQRILDDEISGEEVYEKYQNEYPELSISDGFMYKKTSLVKEDV